MTLRLLKKQSVNLDKDISLALTGFNWEIGRYDGNNDFDLDVSVFLLGKMAKFVTMMTLYSTVTWNTTAVL